MSLIAFPFRRYGRAAFPLACFAAALVFLPALGQEANPVPKAAVHGAGCAAKPAAVIQHIAVEGAQRVEPATVLSYLSVREGDSYDEAAIDRSLKTLFATGPVRGREDSTGTG